MTINTIMMSDMTSAMARPAKLSRTTEKGYDAAGASANALDDPHGDHRLKALGHRPGNRCEDVNACANKESAIDGQMRQQMAQRKAG